MKSIVLTDITTSAAAKIKKGTLDHLQNAYTELLIQLANSIGGQNLDPTTTAPYVLSGLVNTGSGSNYIYSAGLILYNGELYQVPAATFTLGGGETVVATITTAYITAADSDPVEFSDGSSHNIHRNRTIVLDNAVSGTGTFDFLTDAIYQNPATELTYAGGYGANWSGTIKYIKNRDGLVSITGNVQCASGPPALSQVIFTLPVGYRPRATTYINSLKYRSAPLLDGCVIRIDTNGQVLLDRVQTALAINDYMFMDSISFYTPILY